jgi:hypothetical protein
VLKREGDERNVIGKKGGGGLQQLREGRGTRTCVSESKLFHSLEGPSRDSQEALDVTPDIKWKREKERK